MFDCNSEPFIKPRANRYAHKNCEQHFENSKSQEERDLEQLTAYIKHLFVNPNQRVWKQVKEYRQQGYTYSGMYKTLVWWFEIKHGDIEKAHGGIGIIPYVYQEASQYYYALYLAQIVNQDADIEHLAEKTREFVIASPVPKRKSRRLFKFKEEE